MSIPAVKRPKFIQIDLLPAFDFQLFFSFFKTIKPQLIEQNLFMKETV